MGRVNDSASEPTFNDPLLALAIGVLNALTITTSFGDFLDNGLVPRVGLE
jgi:hypothetical protein